MSINYLNQIRKRNGFGFTGIFYSINNTQKQTTTFKFNHQNIYFIFFFICLITIYNIRNLNYLNIISICFRKIICEEIIVLIYKNI